MLSINTQRFFTLWSMFSRYSWAELGVCHCQKAIAWLILPLVPAFLPVPAAKINSASAF